MSTRGNLADMVGRCLVACVPSRFVLRPRLFEQWERKGVHVLATGYYSPVPTCSELSENVWSSGSGMAGVDVDLNKMTVLLDGLIGLYGEEFAKLPLDPPESGTGRGYWIRNEYFPVLDALAHYGMIRQHRPKRIIEVGSGFSTWLAAAAIAAVQREEPGYACDFVTIDPLGGEAARSNLPTAARQIVKKVQDVPLSEFARLESGDFLFIDSSHVSKVGSDVNYEFLEVLPRVKPGVFVHVHDIFFPGEYPKSWHVKEHRFWNEQYLLRAFLSFNTSFEVLWCTQWLMKLQMNRIRSTLKVYDQARSAIGGTSFWMRRVR